MVADSFKVFDGYHQLLFCVSFLRDHADDFEFGFRLRF